MAGAMLRHSNWRSAAGESAEQERIAARCGTAGWDQNRRRQEAGAIAVSATSGGAIAERAVERSVCVKSEWEEGIRERWIKSSEKNYSVGSKFLSNPAELLE